MPLSRLLTASIHSQNMRRISVVYDVPNRNEDRSSRELRPTQKGIALSTTPLVKQDSINSGGAGAGPRISDRSFAAFLDSHQCRFDFLRIAA